MKGQKPILKGAEPGRIRVAAMCAHTVSAREVISLRGQLVFVTKMTIKGVLEMISAVKNI